MSAAPDPFSGLREALAAATPGPWVVTHAGNMHYGVDGPLRESGYRLNIVHAHADHADHAGYGNGSSEQNAAYIKEADPSTISRLLAEYDAMREVVDAAQSWATATPFPRAAYERWRRDGDPAATAELQSWDDPIPRLRDAVDTYRTTQETNDG